MDTHLEDLRGDVPKHEDGALLLLAATDTTAWPRLAPAAARAARPRHARLRREAHEDAGRHASRRHRLAARARLGRRSHPRRRADRGALQLLQPPGRRPGHRPRVKLHLVDGTYEL